MVGDTFAFEQQSAQPDRARWRHGATDGFGSLAIGPGISDRRVAGNAPGQPRTVGQTHADEALFDPFVRPAQAFFQTQHAFTHRREAEMAGLDDAGVDRANGDFMHAIAFDANESIVFVFRLKTSIRGVTAQREIVGRPVVVAQPGAQIAGVRADAEQVARGTLHAVGSRERQREVRENRIVGRQGQRQTDQTLGQVEGDVQGETELRIAVALVAAP